MVVLFVWIIAIRKGLSKGLIDDGYMIKFKARETILCLFWTGAVFSYFFQFPVKRLSSLIVPFLAVFILSALITGRKLSVKGNWGKVYVGYVLYLLVMTAFSAIEGVEIQNILRFLLILLMIPLFCIIDPGDFSTTKKVFIFLAVLKSLLLIYYALAMFRAGSYVEFRQWARENNYGDMYINPTTHIPCVMVQGNGILPIAFLVNLEDKKISGIKRKAYNAILLIGMIVAGNMAFFLAIAVYFGIKILKTIASSDITRTKQLLLSILLLIATSGFLFVGVKILGMKAEWSNAIRLQQAKVLLNNYLIVGNGIGHKIFADTGFRVYSGDTYFELQTLYIYNQIGITGMILFYYLVFSPFHHTSKTNLYIFIAYIAYSFWNPYCFDTTQMITITLLMNYPLFRWEKESSILLIARNTLLARR